MNKDEALVEFLRSLKITLNVSTLYNKEHPSFIKSAEEFKEKCIQLHNFVNPIKINIAVNNIFVDGKDYTKEALCADMVGFLHNHKIKSIEIRSGIVTEEVVVFMTMMALRTQEIINAGGIGEIISKEKLVNIKIEELEYSHLLKGEGEEVQDVWKYLLNEAVEEQSAPKYEQFSAGFSQMISKLKTDDFVNDEQLQRNLDRFLSYLKQTKSMKYSKFSQDMLKNIIKERHIADYDNLDNLKEFLKNFDSNDMANVLVNQLATDTTFDALNMKLFFRLSDEEKHQETANSIKDILENSSSMKENFQVRKRIKELLTFSDNTYVSDIYRNTLSSLLQQDTFSGKARFDRKELQINYFYILLNMLYAEQDYDKLKLIVERLVADWDVIARGKDWDYIKSLMGALAFKKSKSLALGELFLELETKISGFIEQSGLGEENSAQVGRLVDIMEFNFREKGYYLEMIFSEYKVGSGVLKMLFKFFPESIGEFCKRLDLAKTNIELIEKIILGLKLVSEPIAIKIYEHIYSTSSEFIKIDVLKAWQELKSLDQPFILAILRSPGPALRKEALFILRKDAPSFKKALNALLLPFSPFGFNNGYIMENISLAEEFDLWEAKEQIGVLSKKRFFWNNKLRLRAKEVLSKWQ